MDELSEGLAAHQTDTFTGSSPSGAAVATLSANGELLGVTGYRDGHWPSAASV